MCWRSRNKQGQRYACKFYTTDLDWLYSSMIYRLCSSARQNDIWLVSKVSDITMFREWSPVIRMETRCQIPDKNYIKQQITYSVYITHRCSHGDKIHTVSTCHSCKYSNRENYFTTSSFQSGQLLVIHRMQFYNVHIYTPINMPDLTRPLKDKTKGQDQTKKMQYDSHF